MTLAPDIDEWKWGDATEAFPTLMARRFTIVGYLPNRNQHMRVEDAQVLKPRQTSNGCAAELIGAQTCLLSDGLVPDPVSRGYITALRIPLGALWPWLDYPMPETQDTPEHHVLRYPVGKQQEFSLDSGTVAIEIDVAVCHDLKKRVTELTQVGWVHFCPRDALHLDKTARTYLDIEDLFVLLTDQECGLDWPHVEVLGSNKIGALYCKRRRMPNGDFSAFDCWVQFPRIADLFGEIVDNWMKMREEYGPAFHLYLGTRRGPALYVEHRFVNLVFGLEALHRQSHQVTQPSKLDAKIQRILDGVDPALKPSDLKWLTRLLDGAREPRLAERMRELFSGLPIGLDRKSLTEFTEKCAQRRNDISHFGGPRQSGGYSGFLLELHQLSGALDQLYHTAILQQVGIPDELIRYIFFKSFKSTRIRSRLQQAGLHVTEPKS